MKRFSWKRCSLKLTCAVAGVSAIALAGPVQNAVAYVQKVAAPNEAADDGLVPSFIAENLGELITLKLSGDRLVNEYCTEYQKAETTFQTLGRNSSGGSSGGGNGCWQCVRANDKWVMAGSCGMVREGFATRNDPDVGFELGIVDKGDSGWRLQVWAKDKSQTTISTFAKDSPSAFFLSQSGNGSIFLCRITPDRISAGSDTSYGQLLKSHPLACHDSVPVLQQWGLTKLSGRFSSITRDFLLQAFLPQEPQSKAAFDEIVAQMSAASFDTREQASKSLQENSKQNMGLILAALLRDDLPPEPRNRLRKALEAVLKQVEFEAWTQIEKQRLGAEPEQLVWLLGEATDEPTRKNILRQLEKVSGLSLGDDLTAWKDWLAKSGKQTVAPSGDRENQAPDSYPTLQGTLSGLAADLRNLLPLSVRGGRFELDREFWATMYEGKSVEQLGQDLRQYVADHKLPADWLSFDEDGLRSFDYPQLIFARLESSAKSLDGPRADDPNARGWGGPYQLRLTRNPDFQTRAIRASLEVDEGSHLSQQVYFGGPVRADRSKKPMPLIVSLTEKQNPAHGLLFGTWPNGFIRLTVTSPTSLVQIFQAADGRCHLDCAVANDSYHREFKSADELSADEHFKEKVAPYLKQYGLEISRTSTEPQNGR